METIEIIAEMALKARKLAGKANKEVSKLGPNYTGLEAQERYYNGYLGELAFLSWLREKEIKAIYTPRIKGKSDAGDFILFGMITGLRRTVDVKSASKAFHANIMLPEAQMERHKKDYYIGIKINGSFAEIWGFCRAKDFTLESSGFDGAQIRTLFKSLDSLISLDKFTTLVRKGEVKSDM